IGNESAGTLSELTVGCEVLRLAEVAVVYARDARLLHVVLPRSVALVVAVVRCHSGTGDGDSSLVVGQSSGKVHQGEVRVSDRLLGDDTQLRRKMVTPTGQGASGVELPADS